MGNLGATEGLVRVAIGPGDGVDGVDGVIPQAATRAVTLIVANAIAILRIFPPKG